MSMDAYLSPKELADRFDVTERTAVNWAKEGRYGAYRVGGRWRFPDPLNGKSEETEKPQGLPRREYRSPVYM